MKLGKRRRRAVIRLRHALAQRNFSVWCWKRTRTVYRVPWRTPEWHKWHALGCP